VVGLTNASGNTVEVYEYDVYGRVGATDASHPNRFMFTGREYDKETGLYYYRARYYNPQIGRFLQTDPTGYKDGMNWYAYCHNNATCDADPTGLETVYTFLDMASAHATAGLLTFAKVVDNQVVQTQGFADTKAWMNWAKDHPYYFENGPSKWVPEIEKRTGYKLASAAEAEDKENQSTVFSDVFWALQALQFMGDSVAELERTGVETIHIVVARKGGLLDQYNSATNTLKWNINDSRLGRGSEWLDFKDPLIALAHELVHARDDVISHMAAVDEVHAVRSENNVRALFRAKAPKCRDLYPRPGWSVLYADIAPGCDAAWALYRPQNVAK
jgi:RHS repeat-associated protein